MGYLAAQGAILAIGIVIGLICSVIGLFFGHIILFDSICPRHCCRSVLQFFYTHSSGTLYSDRDCGISAAVMAATYQNWLLGGWRTAHTDLCCGIGAAGIHDIGA